MEAILALTSGREVGQLITCSLWVEMLLSHRGWITAAAQYDPPDHLPPPSEALQNCQYALQFL